MNMNRNLNQQLVAKYCDARNTINPALLNPILDDKVEYHSQTVLEVKKGKIDVFNYLSSMFEAIEMNNIQF